MPPFEYQTILAPTKGLYKEKGSKFLSFAYPVVDEVSIKGHLETLRKEYFDARHHCYAWILGPEKKHVRANDDGEPNHSAGDPILGQIRSRNLTDTLVVVVRYFGGTKLGVGGLIAAYKTAAEDALTQATIVLRDVKVVVNLQYDYADMPEVMRLIKTFEIEVLAQDFQTRGCLTGQLQLRHQTAFEEKVELLRNLGHGIERVG